MPLDSGPILMSLPFTSMSNKTSPQRGEGAQRSKTLPHKKGGKQLGKPFPKGVRGSLGKLQRGERRKKHLPPSAFYEREKQKPPLPFRERVGVRVILGTAGSEESVLPGTLEGRRGLRSPYR